MYIQLGITLDLNGADDNSANARKLLSLDRDFRAMARQVAERETTLKREVLSLQRESAAHKSEYRTTQLVSDLEDSASMRGNMMAEYEKMRSTIRELSPHKEEAEEVAALDDESGKAGEEKEMEEKKEEEMVIIVDDDDSNVEVEGKGKERGREEERKSQQTIRSVRNTQSIPQIIDMDDSDEGERPMSPDLILPGTHQDRRSSMHAPPEKDNRSHTERDMHEAYQKENQKLKNELQVWRQRSGENQNLSKSYQKLKDELRESQQRSHKERQEQQKLKEENQKLNGELHALRQRPHEEQGGQQNLKNENQKLKYELQALQQEHQKLKNAHTTLQGTHRELETSFESLRELSKKTEKISLQSMDNLEKQLNQCEESFKKMRIQYDNLSDTVNYLRTELGTAKKSVQTASELHKKDSNALESKIREMKMEIDQQRATTAETEKRCDQYKHNLESELLKVRQLTQELENAKQNERSLKGIVERLSVTNDRLEKESAEAKSVKQRSQGEQERAIEAEKVIVSQRKTIKDNESHISALQSQLQKYEESHDRSQHTQKEQKEEDFKRPKPKVTGKRPRENEKENGTNVSIAAQNSQRKQVMKQVPAAKKRKSSNIVITFSGFKKGLKNYEPSDRELLKQDVKALGGEAIETSEHERLPDIVTHVIAQPTVRTMKVLGAILTGKWVVNADWLKESKKNKSLLTDDNIIQRYGYRDTNSKFLNKSFHFSKKFDNNSGKARHARKLIEEYCRGTIVNERDQANFILMTGDEVSSVPKGITWNTFLNDIYPSNP